MNDHDYDINNYIQCCDNGIPHPAWDDSTGFDCAFCSIDYDEWLYNVRLGTPFDRSICSEEDPFEDSIQVSPVVFHSPESNHTGVDPTCERCFRRDLLLNLCEGGCPHDAYCPSPRLCGVHELDVALSNTRSILQPSAPGNCERHPSAESRLLFEGEHPSGVRDYFEAREEDGPPSYKRDD